MKKKRGFTLVELLAVIIVLAIILLIAIPMILGIVNKAKIESFDKTKKLVENAARNYTMLNEHKLKFEDNKAVIPLDDLKDYIDEVVDPNGEKCKGQVIVTRNNDNSLVYKANLSCGEGYKDSFSNAPVINLNSDTIIYLWKDIDSYVETVSVIDSEDGDLTNDVIITIKKQSDNTIVGGIDTSFSDSYTITYNIIDSDNNAVEKSKTVVVREDNDNPLINIINNTNGVKEFHDVSVVINDISDIKKYYMWTTTSDTPSSDNVEWVLFEEDNNITGIGSLVYGSTGKYFLHIKAIDIYSQESIVSDDNALVFDNDDPIVNFNYDNLNFSKSHTVSIDIEETNLESKSFIWSATNSFPSKGFEEFSTSDISIDSLNGSFYLHVIVKDKAGHEIKKTSNAIKLDNVLPSISIVNNTSGVRSTHDVTVGVLDASSFEKYYMWTSSSSTPNISDSSWVNYSYDSELTGTTSSVYESTGDYYLHVKVVDEAGNVNIVSNQNYLSFNNTNDLEISFNVDNSNIAKSHTVSVVVNGSNIANKYYKWSNSLETPTSDWNILNSDSVSISGVSGGFYLHVKVINSMGISKSDVSNKVIVDVNSPVISINLDNSSYRQSHSLNTYISDLYFDNGVKYYQFNNSSATPLSNDSSWISYTGNTIIKSGVTGQYYLHVKAIDDAGNVSLKTSAPIYFDNSNPSLSLSSVVSGNSVIITANASDSGGSGFYRIKKPNDTYNNSTMTTYTVYSNGTYYFYAYDYAGNVSSRGITINNFDSTKPSLSLSYTPTNFTNGSVIITALGSDTGGSGFNRIKKPDGTFVYSSSASYTVSTNNSYTFYAYDNAGNSFSKTVTISNIDNSKPTLSYSSSPNGYTNNSVIISVTGSDSGSSGFYRIKKPDGSYAISSSATYSVSSNDTYDFYGYDRAGNSYHLPVEIINIDKTKPSLSLSSYLSGDVVKINVVASDDGGSNFYRVKNPDNSYTYIDNYQYTVDKNDTYSFVVYDNAGNSYSESIAVNQIVEVMYAREYILSKESILSNPKSGIDGLARDTSSTGYISNSAFTPQYHYVGSNPKNYFYGGGNCWSIINIAAGGKLKLVYENSGTCKSRSTSTGWISGYFDFDDNSSTWNGSLAKSKVESFYNGLNSSFRSHTGYSIWYVARLEVTPEQNLLGDFVDERRSTSLGYAGLINPTDFIKASTSPSCTDAYDAGSSNICKTDNYLYKGFDHYWTMNGLNNVTDEVWKILGGKLNHDAVDMSSRIRPVIYLKADTIITGLGTYSTPYSIK